MTTRLSGISLWVTCVALVPLAVFVGCIREADSAPGENRAAGAQLVTTSAGSAAEKATAGIAEPRAAASASRVVPPTAEAAGSPPGALSSAGQPATPAVTADSQLFAGWPNPKVALLITGEQHGYIEPCGCTGLTNQKGGLSRRHTLSKQLAARGWPLVPIDAGNQVRRVGRQAEIKLQVTIEGLKRIGYRAIGFGPDDLQLSPLELVAITASTDQQSSPFVCANAAVLDPTLTPSFQVVEAGGVKIGVTAVLGSEARKGIASSEILLKEPEEGLQAVVSQLRDQKCDLHVLMASASLEEARNLAEQFPLFEVVVSTGGLGDPTYELERIPGTNAILVQVGIKGMFAGVLGVFDDPRQRFRYQRVPLDGRFEDSREMLQLLGSYQEQLQALGLEGLGIRPIPDSSGHTYAGSEACQECHSYEYEVWLKTPHAHALESLVQPGERSDVPRHFDPECLSCHVVGWNPQQHFPYVTGYLGLKTTPLVHNVGCESCHGPGAEHVKAEAADAKVAAGVIDELRNAAKLPLDQAEKKCMDCHDFDNSPAFHKQGAFDEYWKKVEHRKVVPQT